MFVITDENFNYDIINSCLVLVLTTLFEAHTINIPLQKIPVHFKRFQKFYFYTPSAHLHFFLLVDT